MEFLTEDIKNVPVEFKALLQNHHDARTINRVAVTLGQSSDSYEKQQVGGRLLLFVQHLRCTNLVRYAHHYRARLLPRVLRFIEENITKLESIVRARIREEFFRHDYFSAGVYISMYGLKRHANIDSVEFPTYSALRQAIDLYQDEGYDRTLAKFYQLCDKDVSMATPCIRNAGTQVLPGKSSNQKGSCFMFEIADTLPSITNFVSEAAEVFKHTGGVGTSLSMLRESGINLVGESGGPCQFLPIYDAAVTNVSQAGARNGAMTAFLRSSHKSFDRFIKLTDPFPKKVLEKVNTACWMDDDFWECWSQAVKNEESGNPNKVYWYLFCPNTAPKLQRTYGHRFTRAYNDYVLTAPKIASDIAQCRERSRLALDNVLNFPDSESYETEWLNCEDRLEELLKQEVRYSRVDPIEIVDRITTTQIRSGQPYMMNADPINYKNNQKSEGTTENSNLCLEMILPSRPGMPASCNLASNNLANFTIGKIDWKRNPNQFTYVDVTNVYDFGRLGTMTRYAIDDICKLIYTNINVGDIEYISGTQLTPAGLLIVPGKAPIATDYVVDGVFPPGKKIKLANGNVCYVDGLIIRGAIAKRNYQMMPAGLGVSGQADALYQMDAPYESYFHLLFNRMAYACMQFNAQIASMILAVRDGEYENFRVGNYEKFVGIGQSGADEYGFVQAQGCPLSNGQFQHDLWEEEADYLESRGRLAASYKREANKPLDPSKWGQTTLYAYVQQGCSSPSAVYCGALPETQLKEPLPSVRDTWAQDGYGYSITSHRRDCREGEIEIVIEPTWDALQALIVKYGVRNSMLLALMPTASSSQLLRNAECTETHQNMIYSRRGKTGYYVIVVRHLFADLREMNLWNEHLSHFIQAESGSVRFIRAFIEDHPLLFTHDILNVESVRSEAKRMERSDFVALPSYEEVFDRATGKLLPAIRQRLDYITNKFKTMYEIPTGYRIRLARERGPYICQSESFNVYEKTPTNSKLAKIHKYCNEQRLKTGMYYLRQSPPSEQITFATPAWIVEYHNALLLRLKVETVKAPVVPATTATDKPDICYIGKPDCSGCSA